MQARILAGECDWEMMDEMLLQGVPFSVFTQSVIDNREHKEFSGTSNNFIPGWTSPMVQDRRGNLARMRGWSVARNAKERYLLP